jgi:molybdopterin/thiamine biosynthesis adenylyltransferase
VQCIINEKLSLANAEGFIKGATLLVNASDTRSGFYLIHNYAHRHHVPVVEGHGWKMTGIKIRAFDYRNPAQRKYNEPFRSGLLNRLASPLFDASRVDFATVTQEFVDRMDTGDEMSGGSIGTTTTLVGCVIAAEAVKLLTGKGVTVCHPLEMYLDLFSMRLRVGHKNSLSNILGTVSNRRREIWRNLLRI